MIWEKVLATPSLTWGIKQRALWMHLLPSFTLRDRADWITCPMLICRAENDPIAHQADEFYAALTCPKDFILFTAEEGAGDHCEMEARMLLSQRVFDWLDETLTINGQNK
jgi:alpha-beta hydrolase superfamily lysophospholipase